MNNQNIQGISFKNKSLNNREFCSIEAGLTLISKLQILFCCIFFSLISEIIIFWVGRAIEVNATTIIVGLILFGIVLAFIFGVIYLEFRTILIYFIVTVVSLIVFIIAISPSSGELRVYTIPLHVGLMMEIGLIGGFTILVTTNVVLRTIIVNPHKPYFPICFIILPLIGAVYIVLKTGGYRTALQESPMSFVFFLLFTIFLTVLAVYISHRSQVGYPKYRVLRLLAITICSIKGTNFQEADLTDADFRDATLGNTNFTKANLTRTYWLNAKNLDKARVEGTYLENEKIRQLLVTGNGRDQNFDGLDLRGCNLQYADLTDASFIGTKLSEATLEGANLTRAKLVKAQLYGTNLTNAILTGACIQDWAISLDTQFEGIKCDYVYMRLETKEDRDPWRKPDNRNEIFRDGDFSSFIAPIIKTQQLYQTQNVDLREVAENYSILDIFHHEGVDPGAAAIAFQRLIEKYPESGLQVLSIEGRGNDKIHFQAQVTDEVNRSLLSQEYNEIYHQIKSGSYQDLLALLAGVSEKDKYIVELRNLLETALKQNRFYVQTYQETQNIEIRKGDYRETSINEGNYRETSINEGNYRETSVNEGNYRETSVNDRGSYVEGDSHHNSPE